MTDMEKDLLALLKSQHNIRVVDRRMWRRDTLRLVAMLQLAARAKIGGEVIGNALEEADRQWIEEVEDE